jgi:hypothetical protein
MSDENPEPPDLDLINKVQQARMMHDSQTKPSEVSGVYWIEAKCDSDDFPPPTPRSGQWVIDIPAHQADAVWEQIKSATEQGKLGYKSRISTASRSGKHPDSRAVCVRTYDSADESDVHRVGVALEALEIDGEWRYERD